MGTCLASLIGTPPPSPKRAPNYRPWPIKPDHKTRNTKRSYPHALNHMQHPTVTHKNCEARSCPSESCRYRIPAGSPWIIVVQEEVAVKKRSKGSSKRSDRDRYSHRVEEELRRQQNEKIAQRPAAREKRVRFLLPLVSQSASDRTRTRRIPSRGHSH